MSYLGHVRNGVVVLDDQATTLPEGVAVVVVLPAAPEPPTLKRRVTFPLVVAGAPGSVTLTSERIGELLDDQATAA